ncbi:Phosphatidylserine decarboxylase (plasmid) [Haloterrigena turkmenica DSM 5511]|uniref:Phosphatidylserine decarboxylase n=1 Tax=Haloterrigena turkmenica (strain ATCC 51198 / DSM 5511 / JCM 9101 / NCIMB 13204 / VKM B-1734 / 4k) TaxID=543526 RepID=D2S3B7_HALTV|nr:protein sorting system archaetidylserine decarboxylase [Haloterrigena turkmenica]ADB63864.1 Phosphatidylserine decarboxylase [Haloterrigena turkmenica DSM 5511]
MNFAPGAWKYAIPALLAAPFALLFSATVSLIALAVGAGTLAFFRDPDRTPPPTGVVSPADGTVSVLREEGDRVRLGVFMNVWHVHVVRSPFDASVIDLEHVSGANRPAFSKESDRNERVHVRCETESSNLPESEAGADLEDADAEDPHSRPDEPAFDAQVTLIAGAFARRIFPYVEPGDDLERGERLGHIAFGSRVDVLFPPEVDLEDISVENGDSMTAGETVVLESGASLGGEIDLGAGSDIGSGLEDEGGDESPA